MEENKYRSDEKSLARRRLIRGVFSAPVALTLHSGSAIAGSSNPLRALAKLAGEVVAPIVDGEPKDSWIRVPEYSVTGLEAGEDAVTVVDGRNLALYYESPRWAFIDPGEYAKVTDGSDYELPENSGLALTGRHVTVRFNPETGDIIGVASDAGTAATCSALTTFSNVCAF